ncbi:hypothetical protein DICA2_F24322 [Diutina catenulata]
MLPITILWAFFTVVVFARSKPTTSTPIPRPTPSTIIDILSSQAQYSKFLRLLQRSEMVPVINRMSNVTVLAPVNSAFSDEGDIAELYKYIIPQQVRVGWMGRESTVYSTLYQLDESNYTVEIIPDFESMEYVVDAVSPIVEEDIYAKHQHSFIQGVMRLLPVKPSVCQVLLNSSMDSVGAFNVVFVKTLVSSLETRWPGWCHQFTANRRTMFIPSDAAVARSLSPTQRQYYTSLFYAQRSSKFAMTKSAAATVASDIASLLEEMAVGPLVIGANNTKLSFPGRKLTVHNNTLAVNGVPAASSVTMADGVLHVFDERASMRGLGVKGTSISLEKALIGLHYSKYAKELKYRKLRHLIHGKHPRVRLFVDISDRDDVGDDDVFTVTKFSSKQHLLYQFGALKGSPALDDSLLCSKKRIGGCFRHRLSWTNSSSLTAVNDAQVLEGPYISDDGSEIYVVDSGVSPPPPFKRALGELMSSGHHNFVIDHDNCITTLELLLQHKLLDLSDDGGYTIFLPCRKPASMAGHSNWDGLGLVQDYLEAHNKTMKQVLKGLFAREAIYSDNKKSTEVKLLSGEHVTVSPARHGRFRINHTEVAVPLNSDVLFNGGVIHLVDKVLLPESLTIPLADLIGTTIEDPKAASVLDLLAKRPGVAKAIGLDGSKPKYVLLIPSQASLTDFNITGDFKQLADFLQFHLVPVKELPTLLACSHGVGNSSYPIATNLSDTALVCRVSGRKRHLQYVDPSKFGVTWFGASGYSKDHQVQLVSHGCVHPSSPKEGPCVFVVDKPLNLAWLQPDSSFPHIHLGWVSLGIGVICGMLLVVLLSVTVVFGSLRRKSVQLPLAESDPFAVGRPSFIKIMAESPEDHLSGLRDRGYETDIDIFKENDELTGLRKKWKRRYGATSTFNESAVDNTSPPEQSASTPKAVPRQIKTGKSWQNPVTGCDS